ncbi:MAG TPA: nuclear transport factor 2 family protein [Terriglobia bacterium]|nr:nuclear transport factor 2 family protein [Terriglobia bacterium]
MTLSQAVRVASPMLVIIAVVAAYGQQGRWAQADDPTAKFMVDAERQWAEAACTHNKIAQSILADDFQGTSPDGKRYTKSDEVADTPDPSKSARDCRLIDAKVRFFGEGLAMVYGSESSIQKGRSGTEQTRCLIWTDTWLKRNAKWQIIAAQDTRYDCK